MDTPILSESGSDVSSKKYSDSQEEIEEPDATLTGVF